MMQVVLGGLQQLYEQIGRVVSSQGSLMAKQDRGHKLLGSTEAWKQACHHHVRGTLSIRARVSRPETELVMTKVMRQVDAASFPYQQHVEIPRHRVCIHILT